MKYYLVAIVMSALLAAYVDGLDLSFGQKVVACMSAGFLVGNLIGAIRYFSEKE